MTTGCNSQQNTPKEKKNRKAAYADQFYPADSVELKRDLKEYFALSIVKSDVNTLAIIAPHAGYVYSGTIAASAFSAVPPEKQYKRIFIIASSHRMSFEGASVYSDGNYETPLGEIETDTAMATELCKKSDVFIKRNEAHTSEHSLEVQLPFLQHHMKTPVTIVPIILGTQDTSIVKKIAKVLKPYLNDENLFVISTDFSHYPKYNDAIDADRSVATSLVYNKPQQFIDTLSKVESAGISNLATGMCGWPSVLTLMYMTEGNPDIKYSLLEYKNSGDTKYGDKNKVVGYWSVKITGAPKATSDGPAFTDEDKKKLLAIARKTIEEFIGKGTRPDPECKSASDLLKMQLGAFVTLHKKGNLRGCIGQFKPTIPLCELVSDLAISSSTQDYRFSPVTASELKDIDIEISVLTPLKKISDVKEIELGKHGIYIVKGSRSGTFLPQVATGTGWNLEEFLGHCAEDKAGIGWDGWKDADIYTYEAIIFQEKDFQ